MAQWNRLPADLRRNFTGKIARSLAEADPAAGARFLAGLPASERQAAAVSFTAAWAKQDAAAAWSWLNQNVNGRRSDTAESWAEAVAPDEGARVLATAAPSRARDAAGGALASDWMQRDPAAAAAWLLSLDDPGLKRSAWTRAAPGWASQNPEQAVAALTAPGAPPFSADTATEVTRTLLRTRPDLARTFADSLPPHLAAQAQALLPPP